MTMHARLTSVFLLLSALAYLGLGVRFLLWPESGAANLGLAPVDPSGFNSIRSLPGGFQGSIGVLLVLLLRRGDRRSLRDGLYLVLVVSCGFLSGRLLSLLSDGWPNGFVWFATALEVAGVIGAWLLLATATNRSVDR